MYKYLFLIMILFFSGCSIKSLGENDFKGKTQRDYSNVSKDSIFEAVKKIFIYDGQGDFRIDSYRNKLHIERTKLNFPPWSVSTNDDIWDLKISEDDDISKASLEIKKIKDFDEKDPVYMPKKLHDLFWARVDYMLGFEKEWPSCVKYYITEVYTDMALCDYKDFIGSRTPSKDEKLKDILISNRKASRDIVSIDDDILNDDINLILEDSKRDILDKEDKIDDVNAESTDEFDTSLDKEIDKLDKEVTKSINQTLEKIKENEAVTPENIDDNN